VPHNHEGRERALAVDFCSHWVEWLQGHELHTYWTALTDRDSSGHTQVTQTDMELGDGTEGHIRHKCSKMIDGR
jgi:hypothetical protein